MSKLHQLIKEGESLPLATASKAVFRYPFCGGHPRNAPVLSHGFDIANAKPGGMNE